MPSKSATVPARLDRRRMKRTLDALVRRYHHPDYLKTDPLRVVHRYNDPVDMEIAGLVAACLAYGRVGSIFVSVDKVLAALGPRPGEFVAGLTPGRAKKALAGFRHRFTGGREMAWLLTGAGRMVSEHGSLREGFLAGFDPEEATIRGSMERVVEALRGPGADSFYPKGLLPRPALFLLPSPAAGSACKRLNLFLRWMVRPADGLDVGLWPEVATAKLVMPLDTHVARVARFIGLAERTTPDWRMAEEVTANLRRLDPGDPVRYDFALSRLGIVRDCAGRRVDSLCGRCALEPICLAAAENEEMG